MQRWLKSNRFYYRILISFLVILIIPVILIGLYVNARVFQAMRDQVIMDDLNHLYQLKSNMESSLERTGRIKEEVYLSTYRSPFLFKEDPLRGVELIDELKSYTTTNPFLNEVFLYFNGDDYVYRSKGSAPVNMFFDELYQFENWDREEALNTFAKMDEVLYRPMESIISSSATTEEVMTIIYPLSLPGNEPYAVLAFSIEREYFDLLLNDVVGTSGKVSLITDENNKIIAISHNGSLLAEEMMEQLVDGKGSVEIDGTKYVYSNINADTNGWHYISLTPLSYINDSLKEVRDGFIFGVAGVIIIGLIGVLLAMRMNYSPIKNLSTYSKELMGSSQVQSGEKGKGELELVRNAIDYLSVQNEELHSEVEDSNVANRQYITMQILKGGRPFEGALEEKAAKYDVIIYKQLAVVVFYMNTKEEFAITKAHILERLQIELGEDIKVYASDNMDLNKVILIVTADHIEEEMLDQSLCDVQHSIHEKFGVSTSIGVSSVYSDKEFIPKAYMEASTAVDYRLVKGSGCVVKYNQIVEGQTGMEAYPKDHVKRIGRQLKEGKIEAINEELLDIEQYIKSGNLPIFIVRGLCFDIINTIFMSSKEVEYEYQDFHLEIPDVFSLSKYETVDELIDLIKEISHELSKSIIEQRNKEELSVIHEMVVYIQNNYTDLNFSLLGMADFFNMSQSGLSMYFKEKTGQTILNYVTKMKIDKAKELLTTTKLPLSELSKAIGYNNVTSFIRRFKQWEGITPGEYRKKH